MSKNVFNSKNFGDYYFFLFYIELNDEKIGISPARAQDILSQGDTTNLNSKELAFLSTFTHEATHLLDSTTTLWGLEYCNRLFNCFNSGNSAESIKVFATNHSEIEQHEDMLLPNKERLFNFREMRSVLSYDDSHGVHIQFKYYDHVNGSYELVHTTAASMLSLLEGHAFSIEKLLEYEIHENNNDTASLCFLETDYNNKLQESQSTEYTCFLAFVDKLYPSLEFKHRLKLFNFACHFTLNMPALGFPFPSDYIDVFFKSAEPKLVSTLKMELNRGMNRSSLLCLILMVVKFSIEDRALDKIQCVEKQIEERFYDIFRMANQSLAQLKSSFNKVWRMEYNLGCELLEEKGFYLAKKIAESNIERSWHRFELSKVQLPPVGLGSGSFVYSPNIIDYDIEEHFFTYSDSASSLKGLLQKLNVKKPHLSPDIYHAWLDDIQNGVEGIKFYEAE